jgi:hypothetical protein
MKLEFSWHIFEKSSNIEFHENASCGSRVVPRRWMDRRRDITKLIVAFHNVANVPITVCRMFLIFSFTCNEYCVCWEIYVPSTQLINKLCWWYVYFPILSIHSEECKNSRLCLLIVMQCPELKETILSTLFKYGQYKPNTICKTLK